MYQEAEIVIARINQLESDKNTFEDTLMEKFNIIDERIEKLSKKSCF